ncbi:ATP-binding cassette domain-containing protein [Aquimarina agarivorans]|uniref:ATP-binding cassette domain-containing protein n=1 Tax=Aquimarina agarivorans TaxID=980584 RepID=UPI000248E9EC|nr:ATP-binding cassette domain-containing protein [Aquimarina agarivorans]
MIELKNISKSFGNHKVLHSISMQLKQGKVYGIVGHNGAGKTTLFRCIANLENYKGNITSTYGSIKDQLGYLMTEPFIFDKVTGKEYIQLLLNARNLKNVDIDSQNIFDLPLNQYASSYSTGMKKKLTLTAILLQKNNYFILDEPFNGVDIQSNLVIIEIIQKLKELNKTLLISSHIFFNISRNL